MEIRNHWRGNFYLRVESGIHSGTGRQCDPPEAYWKSFDPSYGHSYTCADTKAINAIAGVFAVLGGSYSVVLPILMARRLRIPLRQRIALNAVFSFGLIVVLASCLRTYYLMSSSRSTLRLL